MTRGVSITELHDPKVRLNACPKSYLLVASGGPPSVPSSAMLKVDEESKAGIFDCHARRAAAPWLRVVCSMCMSVGRGIHLRLRETGEPCNAILLSRRGPQRMTLGAYVDTD